jgi:hypothetical protein
MKSNSSIFSQDSSFYPRLEDQESQVHSSGAVTHSFTVLESCLLWKTFQAKVSWIHSYNYKVGWNIEKEQSIMMGKMLAGHSRDLMETWGFHREFSQLNNFKPSLSHSVCLSKMRQ